MLKKLVDRPAALVMHIALLLIVSGAIVTSLSARKGVIHVRIGDVATSYSENKKGGLPLPFALRLDDFAVEYYPGTDTPSDYRSSVSVLIDGECVKSAQVSMNRILSYDGYRFYQTTYDSDELGSTFTVAHDPVGIGLVYAGYAVFLLAFLIFFFTDKKLRALVRKVTTTVAAIILFFAGTSEISAAENKAPKTLPKETAGQFGELYVFYHGRVCPLQSPLLSVHVSLMMLSYAVLAVIMVNSAAGLCVGAIERRHISSEQTVVQAPASAPVVMRPPTSSVSARLADISMLLLYFGVFFLAAGIISGSFWANVSWGCYWNWDPKETWALITLLIYAVAVHRSDISFLRKPVIFHIFLLLAFVSVLFTYFGVNFLLGGMHSYAG